MNIRYFYERLSRALSYFKLGWNNVDYDYESIFVYLRFKLPRILFNLETGMAIHEPETIKALKVCIHLLDKLNDDYGYSYAKHREKWGELVMTTVPSDVRDDLLRVHIHVEGITTDEQRQQEILESRIASQKDYNRTIKYQRWLFRIMDKYIQKWWD